MGNAIKISISSEIQAWIWTHVTFWPMQMSVTFNLGAAKMADPVLKLPCWRFQWQPRPMLFQKNRMYSYMVGMAPMLKWVVIGSKSDHWLPLSFTHWQTNWLTPRRVVDLVDVTLACEDINSKFVGVVCCWCWRQKKCSQLNADLQADIWA